MKGKLVILPGTPNDANRDYLPEAIKGSDMVVNENGNSSQPYPRLLKEYHGIVADGIEDTWYEYIPSTYDPTSPTPLVVSLHGGMMTGWGQAIYTSWTMVAERDGFICVFPDSSGSPFWKVEWDKPGGEKAVSLGLEWPPEDPKQNHDLNLILGIIDLMKDKYNIDPGRVYMQGMSMGDMMTSTFARHYAHLLAGAGGSGANAGGGLLFDENGKNLNKAGPVAMFMSRPELNGFGDEENRVNLDYWLEVNGITALPQISIQGEDNFAFYTGGKADVVFLDIKNRDHGQTLDDAQLVWDFLFSGVKRNADGGIEDIGSVRPRVGDKFAIAVAKDCGKAWFKNSIVPLSTPTILWQKLKYHGLEGGQKVRGEYLCVPLSFLAEAFDAEYLPSEDTLSATLVLKDGRHLQFARGSIGCVVENRIESMLCEALHRNGELLVSLEWFAQSIFNLHISTCDNVVYATDHYSTLSTSMAELIKSYIS